MEEQQIEEREILILARYEQAILQAHRQGLAENLDRPVIVVHEQLAGDYFVGAMPMDYLLKGLVMGDQTKSVEALRSLDMSGVPIMMTNRNNKVLIGEFHQFLGNESSELN